MSIVERVVTRHLASRDTIASAVRVEERDGVIRVSGPYAAMQFVYPELKKWGFKYNSSDKSWVIKSNDLTPIRRRKFEKLLGLSPNSTPTQNVPAAKAVDERVKEKKRQEEDALRDLFAEISRRPLLGFQVVHRPTSIEIQGPVGALQDSARAAGASTSDRSLVFSIFDTSLSKFKDFLGLLERQSAFHAERFEKASALISKALSLDLLGYKFEMRSNKLILTQGETQSLRARLNEAGGSWDGQWVFSRGTIVPDKFDDVLDILVRRSKKNEETLTHVRKALGGVAAKTWPVLGLSVFISRTSSLVVEGGSRETRAVVERLLPSLRWQNSQLVSPAFDIELSKLQAAVEALDRMETEAVAKKEQEDHIEQETGASPDSKCRPNRHGDECVLCHVWVEPGEGCISQTFDDDTEKFVWVVRHKDKQQCQRAIERMREESRKHRSKREAQRALEKLIRDTGVYPSGSHRLEGEQVYLDSHGVLHGGGAWVVIEPNRQYIWFVVNNGADGDDWSRNNVETGGAGAIGWRARVTPEMLELLEVAREG